MEIGSLSRDVLREVVDKRQDGRKTNPWLSPSGTGQCYRQSAFKYLGVEPSNEVSTALADMGTLWHAGWSAMLAATYKPEVRRGDVPIEIPGVPRAGEADDVDFVNKVVTDLKSISAKTYKWWGEHDVEQHYWDQLELYAYGLHLKYGGDWALCIFAIVRETGEREEFWRDADPFRGKHLAMEIAERHEALMSAVERDQDPTSDVPVLALVDQFPREGAGPGKFPCGWCEWESACWPQDVEAPMTPQSVTLEGDPELIEAKAAEYKQASNEESDAKRRKYAARDFITGYEGDYGKYRLKMMPGTGSEPKPDIEEIEVIFAELGIEIPMTPAKPGTPWLRVGNVPAPKKR